jgi:DNA-binding transcriptional regulator YbjK
VPKVVDRAQRQRDYVAALFRLIDRTGIDGVSLRAIAAEANVPKSTMIHYFSNEVALFEFAMAQVTRSANRDIDERLAADLDLQGLIDATMRAIPGSTWRRRESQIWLWLLRASTSDPAAARVLTKINAAFEGDAIRVLTQFSEAGKLVPGVDVLLEARALHALVDGFSIRALTDPAGLTRDEVERVVGDHLSRIVASPAAPGS